MKLAEAFATRKTYGNPRSRPIQNPTLRKALEAFRRVANTQEIWDELEQEVRDDEKFHGGGGGEWTPEDERRSTYGNAIFLLTRDLEKALQKL